MNNKTLHDQRLLAMLGLYTAPIDGIEGNKTISARAEFCENEEIQYQDVSELLIKKIKSLPSLAYDGKEQLAKTVMLLCKSLYYENPAIWAYIMATVEHETNATFYPVIEAYYLPEEQRKRYIKGKQYGPKYYGRGLVQLTWEYNYLKYSNILGSDFIEDPDLVLDPSTSVFILIHGMITGSFTGRALSRYINSSNKDFVNARRIVNGFVDSNRTVAKKIAALAEKWEAYYVSMGKGDN